MRETHLHYCGTIVRDGLPAVAVHQQQIPAVRTERALDRGLHCDAGIDVGNDLSLSLRGIRA
jgi:hypothetical protein